MPPMQSIGNPQISGKTLEELQRSTQWWMQHLTNKIDAMMGLRGTPVLYSDLDANGKRLQNVSDAVDANDAVAKQQTITLAMNPANGQVQFDAQGQGIFNGSPADHPTDFVTLQQMLQAILDALANAGINASFVTVTSEPLLPNERQAAIEPGVLLLTDNGAGSTLVWSVVANGISNAKLRQGAALSVIGNATNALANVADIVAASDGQVMRRSGAAVGFGAVSLATAAAITGTLPLGNGGTGQTTQTAAFNALDPLTTKGDIIAHNGTDSVRLAVGANGQLPVADSGAATGLAWKGTVQTYTASNVTTDRSYDADATTLDEVADVLGTLINDLRTFGVLL